MTTQRRWPGLRQSPTTAHEPTPAPIAPAPGINSFSHRRVLVRLPNSLTENRVKTKIFIVIAGLILTVTALAKIISAQQAVGYLNLRDPLFEFMTNRQMLSGAAAIELVIVILLFWVKNQQKRLTLIAWLGSVFLLYRVSVHLVGSPGFVPCPCLGNAAALMHMDPVHLDWIIKSLLIYLLVGSYGLLIVNRLREKKGSVSLASSCGVEV